MKRFAALFVVAVMVLSLCGCSNEGAALYEKYASIIDQLENKNYTGAIDEITQMAIQEQKGDVEEIPAMQILCDTWTTASDNGPQELIFNADGTCTIDGKAMSWLSGKHDDSRQLQAEILENGEHRYYLWMSASDSYAVPFVELYYMEERDGNMVQGDYISRFYNNSRISLLMSSWNSIDSESAVVSSFWFNLENMSISGDSYDWAVVETENADSLTVHAEAKNGGEGAYTFVVEMRGNYPVMTVTDDATGAASLYYIGSYGYDESWVEVRYAYAMNRLNSFRENGYFWHEDEHYDSTDESALTILHDLFVDLGDYADAAQILEDWDSLRYIRATRYLESYLESGRVNVNDMGLSENASRAYIYGLFSEISGYEDSAEILSRFTVLPQMYTGAKTVKIDNMGNERTDTYSSYQYDSNGLMTYGYDPHNYENYRIDGGLTFRYDASGRISEIQYGNVTAILTPTYDENGNMVSIDAMYNDGTRTYTYTYNEAGQRIQALFYRGENDVETYTYTYENGRLVELVLRDRWSSVHVDVKTTTYTYDENGYLVEETAVWSREYNGKDNYLYTQTIIYTNDAQGRPVTAEFTTDNTGDNYKSKIVTFTYEDLYFYNAEG